MLCLLDIGLMLCPLADVVDVLNIKIKKINGNILEKDSHRMTLNQLIIIY